MELDEELKVILQRVSDLEGEVSTLKRQLAEMKTPPSHVAEKVGKVHLASIMERLPEQPVRDEVPIQQKVRKEFDLEKVLSNWLPRVFMFILLLGVLWGLKVGMDNGFITNPVRVGMGYTGTILLYFLGMRYYNGGKKGFGLTLLGGFIGLGILTTFAAHLLYGYLNFHDCICDRCGLYYRRVIVIEKDKIGNVDDLFRDCRVFTAFFIGRGRCDFRSILCVHPAVIFITVLCVT